MLSKRRRGKISRAFTWWELRIPTRQLVLCQSFSRPTGSIAYILSGRCAFALCARNKTPSITRRSPRYLNIYLGHSATEAVWWPNMLFRRQGCTPRRERGAAGVGLVRSFVRGHTHTPTHSPTHTHTQIDRHPRTARPARTEKPRTPEQFRCLVISEQPAPNSYDRKVYTRPRPRSASTSRLTLFGGHAQARPCGTMVNGPAGR